MDKLIKIHIFCLKPNICSLIKKTFSQSKYSVTCTPAYTVNDGVLKKLRERFDCIILDMDIEKDIKEKIRSKFQGVPIIYLPSLDSEQVRETDIKYISEPLRLSELANTLDEIFKDRIPS